jgi:tetratricopeptide (TPR) repeat protein
MRTLLALMAGSSLLLAAPAQADEIDALGGKVTELDARIYELQNNLKPPADPGPEIADRRLIDAQVLYELKNYEAASIILFDVVEKYPNSPAYPEALFYLADSLYLKRDFLSSRRFFEKIVEVGPSNPRYQESLQRLIELSLHTGDYTPVDGYIAKLDATQVQKPLPSVPYVKGKYYFFRQQFDKALEAFKPIGPDHKYFFHATYFVGAANVAWGQEHWDDAVAAFSTILKTEAGMKPEQKTDSQKRITELSHMALARIYLERGQLTQAIDEYAKIGQKSDHFNDMLYESAWVAIKGKDYLKARRQLDLLLLSAPDSPLAPEVKLLVGTLHVRQNEYGPATDSFTKTRDEFEPVYKMLETELAKTGDAPSYFRALIEKHLSKFDVQAILPKDSVRWVKDEAEVVRLGTVMNDESDLKRSLDEASEIVKRLERALSGPARVNVFPDLATMRAKATEVQSELTDVKKQLASRESALLGPVAGAQKGQLDALAAERAGLEQRLASLPSKAAGVQERQAKARAAYNELDKRASEIGVGVTGMRQQIDAARKFYDEAARKAKADTLGPPARSDVPPAQPLPPGYVERSAELDKRLSALKGKVDEGKKRLDALKTALLDKPVGQKAEVEAVDAEVDGLRGQLESLRHDILEAATSIGVDDTDAQAAAAIRMQYEDVLKRQHAVGVEVKSRLGGGERTKADQIDSILERARGVEQKLQTFNAKVDELLDNKLKDITSALADEKAKVSAYRDKLAGYTSESTDVGGQIVAASFKAVAQRFYNVVVRSDVGIIDVAWALKDAATKETNRLIAERKRELKLLDDEFKEVLKESP